MIMCVLQCYPVSFHMLQLLLTGCPISSCYIKYTMKLIQYTPVQYLSYIIYNKIITPTIDDIYVLTVHYILNEDVQPKFTIFNLVKREVSVKYIVIVHVWAWSVADFPFQYPASANLYRFGDTKKIVSNILCFLTISCTHIQNAGSKILSRYLI